MAQDNPGYNKTKAANLIKRGIEDIEDFFTGRQSQERQYNYDLAMQNEANKWQEEMWKKTNEYNTPQNELARWMAAGGNPNAYFGGNTMEGASAMSSAAPGNISSTAGMLQTAVGQAVNTAKAYWENRKTKAEAEKEEINNGTLRELNQETINEIKSRVQLNEKTKELTGWQAKQIEQLLPGLVGKTNAEIGEIQERTNNLILQRDEINARISNMNAQTRGQILANEKAEWEKLFRDDFGIDPTAAPMSMLIQNILKGKGTEVLDQLFSYIDQTIEHVFNNENSLPNVMGRKIGQKLKDIINYPGRKINELLDW